MPNPERRNMNISIIVSLAGLVMAFAPVLLDIDVYRGGGAMMLIGIWLFISGIIVAFIFRGRAQALRRLLHGDDTLAHWTYDQTSWEKFHQADLIALTAEMKQMYLLVLAISALICGFLFIAISKERWVFPAVFAFINILTGITALLRIHFARRSKGSAGHDVFIGKNGALVDGSLHLWTGKMARLDQVRPTDDDDGEMPLLIVQYSTLNRYHWQQHTLRIPIPAGKQEEAMHVARSIAPVSRKRAKTVTQG